MGGVTKYVETVSHFQYKDIKEDDGSTVKNNRNHKHTQNGIDSTKKESKVNLLNENYCQFFDTLSNQLLFTAIIMNGVEMEGYTDAQFTIFLLLI